MAESETSICNKALGYLGANTIISLDDKTPEGLLCNEHYDSVRDALLEDIDWAFARKSYRFGAPTVTAGAQGGSGSFDLINWRYGFQLPPEIVRVLSVNDNKYNWEIESNHILTDSSVIIVKATIRVTDASLYPPRFVQCLAALLAANICLPLTNSPSHFETMMSKYGYEMTRAKANDGRQGRNQRRFSTLVR